MSGSSINPENVSVETKHDAKSKEIQYAETVTLKDNSRSRVTVQAFFIPHKTSDEQGLTLRFETYDVRNRYLPIPEKKLSLDESETRILYEALQRYFKLTSAAESGDYLFVKTVDGITSLGNLNPNELAQALMDTLGKSEVVEHLRDAEVSSELLSALQTKIKFSQMIRALDELEELLDSGDSRESTYQKWCEEHSWAFGNAYVLRDDIRSIAANDKVDLLLPDLFGGARDIVELKQPAFEVLIKDASHRDYYFSSKTSEAIGQVVRYLNVFAAEAQKGLYDRRDIISCNPKAIIVIGRSKGWGQERELALRSLNARLSDITVMTYDHLLAQGRRLIEILLEQPDGQIVEDDIPF